MPIARLPSLLLAAALSVGAAQAMDAPSIQDQRLAACYEDMQRLCAGEPTKAKLKTCIRPRRAKVGLRCRAWLDKPD